MLGNDYDPAVERHFRGHKKAITNVTFHPDEQKVATSSLDKTFMVCNFTDSMRANRFIAHKEAIFDVAYAPSGEVVATASKDKTVRIWVPTIRGESLDFRAHMGAVRSVQFSPNGQKLVTASDDKIIKLWMVCRRRFLSAFIGHTNWVRCAKFSPDGKYITSCSDDKTIRLWDLSSGKCVQTIQELRDPAMDVEYHPTGAAIGSANAGGCIKIYDLRTGTLRQHYPSHTGIVNKARFHPNGNFMLTASDDSTMKVLDLLEGRPIYTLRAHNNSAVTAIAFSPTGEFFASGGTDQQLLIWKSNFDKQSIKDKVPKKLFSSTEDLDLESESHSQHINDKFSKSTHDAYEGKYIKDETDETEAEDEQEKEEEEEGEEEDEIAEKLEYLTDMEDVNMESAYRARSYFAPVTEIPGDFGPVKIINMRNSWPQEQPVDDDALMSSHRWISDSNTGKHMDSEAYLEIFQEQIEYVREVLTTLDERITLLENNIQDDILHLS